MSNELIEGEEKIESSYHKVPYQTTLPHQIHQIVSKY